MGTFRFKQFAVTDDGATMKVGTDAILLGAWCPVDNAKRMLDIGTGSGVIALMLAQRSGAGAHIDAVELNADDAAQAQANVLASPWPSKVSVIHTRIQVYRSEASYDLVVSNPPYFANSLLPPEIRRSEARHDTRLTRSDLLQSVLRLLDPVGTFCLILPAVEAESFRGEAQAAGLHLSAMTQFHTRKEKPMERVLMAFSRVVPVFTRTENLILYDSGNQKTTAYRELTGEFYL